MFGNLWNSIKSTASKIGGFWSGNNVANASGAFQAPLLPGLTIQNGRVVQNQTPLPNQSTPYGPGVSYNSGTAVLNNKGQTTGIVSNQSGSSIGFAPTTGGMRPSTYTPTGGIQAKTQPQWTPITDAYSREANKQEGIPYFDAKGNFIVPERGFSGMSGTGGGGYSTANTTPMTGLQGLSGTDYARGSSGFGAGTMSSVFGQPTSDEEERKKKEQGGATNLTTGNNSQDPTTQAANALTAQANSTPGIEAPTFNGTVDMGWLQQTSDALNKMAESGLPESSYQEVLGKIQTNLFNAKTVLDQQMPTKMDYVEDTPEQQEWMQTQEKPSEAMRLMDQWKAEKTNLSELKAQEQEIMKTQKALMRSYDPIFKEIKENPNLPKALARKKIEGIAFAQKEVMDGIVDALAEIRYKIKDQQDAVDDAFQIAKFQDDRENRIRDDQRAAYMTFLQSGAISGIPENQLGKYASKFGVSVNELKGAKEHDLNKNLEKVVNEATGDVTYYDKNWKPVKTFRGIANKPKDTTPKNLDQWEVKQSEISTVNQLMNMRASDGTPYTDQNGYFTAEGFKRILANTKLSRSEFIDQFAGNISPFSPKNYGLTPAEIKKLGFE